MLYLRHHSSGPLPAGRLAEKTLALDQWLDTGSAHRMRQEFGIFRSRISGLQLGVLFVAPQIARARPVTMLSGNNEHCVRSPCCSRAVRCWRQTIAPELDSTPIRGNTCRRNRPSQSAKKAATISVWYKTIAIISRTNGSFRS